MKKKLLPRKRMPELRKRDTHPSGQVEVSKFQIEYLPLSALKLWGKNPRINDKGAVKLAELIKKNGKFIDPIVVDTNGVIRAGNTRYKAAKILGLKEVPVVRVHWEKEGDAVMYAIANNKAHEFTGWDPDILAEAFNTKDVLGFDAAGMTGFSDKELRGINWEQNEDYMGEIETERTEQRGVVRIKCRKEDYERVKEAVVKFIESFKDETIIVL